MFKKVFCSHTMHNIITIFKKEFRSYFNSPIAYIFLVVFLVVVNWFFFSHFFLIDQVSMESFFSILPWIFLIILPSLSMRLWAEEKKSGTMELLMTLPINDYEAVIGKFLAVVSFLGITLALTLPSTLTVISLGNPDAGEIAGSYLGAIFFGGALLALGSFLSGLTKNQIVAFLVTVLCSFVLMILGMDYVLVPVGGGAASVLNFLSLSSHYNVMTRGLIDSGDLVYFIGFIFFFLFLNVKVLQGRYYKG